MAGPCHAPDAIGYTTLGLPQIVLHLQREPVPGSLSECVSEALGQIERDASALGQECIQCGLGDAQMGSEFSSR